MEHHDRADHRPGPRAPVEDATAYDRGSFYAVPVLDRAAALLPDVWALAARRGVQPEQMDMARRCLEAVTPKRVLDAPKTEAEAIALLRLLVVELEALDERVDFDMGESRVRLGTTAQSPAWRSGDRAAVFISMIVGELTRGWLIGPDQARFVKHVVASCDGGAAAVAKLTSVIDNGKFSILLFRS